MTGQTRRATLTALASAPALALPAVAIAAVSPGGHDAELTALAAEIQRLHAQGEEVYAKGVEPFNETFYGLVHSTSGSPRATLDEAFAYSREVGREAAIKEREDIDSQADRLWTRMMAIPAADAGRQGRESPRTAYPRVRRRWRARRQRSDDWEIEQARALLGQFAGMTEEELAAI